MRGSWYKNHPVCGQQMLSFLRLFYLIVIKNSMCQISKWLLLGPVLQSLFKNGMFQNGGSCKLRILDALFCNNHTIYCDVICISTTVTSYVSLQRLRYEVCMTIAKQYSGERNHLFSFLMHRSQPISNAFMFIIWIHFLPLKIVFYLKYILSYKWYRFWTSSFVKVLTFVQEIRCLESRCLVNESDWF